MDIIIFLILLTLSFTHIYLLKKILSSIEPINKEWLITQETSSGVEESAVKQLAELCYTEQIPRRNDVGLVQKLASVIQFIQFVFFTSTKAKKALIQRNEITAEKLIKDYLFMLKSPPDGRADMLGEWRNDIEHFEANKTKLHIVKTNVVEFKLR
jgi:hypothetical protein